MDFPEKLGSLDILAGLFGGSAVVEVEIGIEQVGLAVARLDKRPLEGAHRLVMLLDLAEGNAVVVREQPGLRKPLCELSASAEAAPSYSFCLKSRSITCRWRGSICGSIRSACRGAG